MPEQTYTPLFSEILDKVSKLKTKNQKVAHLRQYNSDGLRQVIKSSFDPKVKWALPDGKYPIFKMMHPKALSTMFSLMNIGNSIILLWVAIHNFLRINERVCSFRC